MEIQMKMEKVQEEVERQMGMEMVEVEMQEVERQMEVEMVEVEMQEVERQVRWRGR